MPNSASRSARVSRLMLATGSPLATQAKSDSPMAMATEMGPMRVPAAPVGVAVAEDSELAKATDAQPLAAEWPMGSAME